MVHKGKWGKPALESDKAQALGTPVCSLDQPLRAVEAQKFLHLSEPSPPSPTGCEQGSLLLLLPQLFWPLSSRGAALLLFFLFRPPGSCPPASLPTPPESQSPWLLSVPPHIPPLTDVIIYSPFQLPDPHLPPHSADMWGPFAPTFLWISF